VSPEDYDRWLDPGLTDPARIADLLRPFDARLMRKYAVSSTVNKVENDSPECAKEIDQSTKAVQSGLFETTEPGK
jgi:putative SOS response-associated peptidase YedK